MSGLDITGFTAEKLLDIQTRIKGKLELFNPGFDFRPESPDGQLIDIMSFELWQAWQQLNMVYNSYDPSIATGAALRNLGQISGISYGTAQRSYATIELQGTAGVLVPANSLVSDDDGNEYFVAFDTLLPSNAQVISKLAGPLPIPAGSIINIDSAVNGWTGVTQTTDGIIGTEPMSDQQFRNFRQSTVMRNYVGTVDTMRGRLIEAGVGQVSVFANNTMGTINTVPAQTVSVVVDDINGVDDETIATIIFETNAVGCPTYSYAGAGATAVTIQDSQGFDQVVNFTKSSAVPIEIDITVLFLDEESAGALESIQTALMDYVNSLQSGADVIYTHLYQYITPYGQAQVNVLNLQKLGDVAGSVNIGIGTEEFASLVLDNLNITVI